MDYKATVLLPKTDFPMKAELPKREPPFLAQWRRDGIYEKILAARQGGPKFVLHDGPPFANGDAHIGHLLNMTLKDIVLKSKNMSGYETPFIPGWDCHGLPIEHKVVKDLGGADIHDAVLIRTKSDAEARKWIAIQSEQFQRLGVFGDWAEPYLTLNPAYEADILRNFADLVDPKKNIAGENLVFQALRPVSWSTGAQTALAEAEVEYKEKVDPAIFVKFPLTEPSLGPLEELAGLTPGDLAKFTRISLAIWTTTPWTLPANLAVAVSAKLIYSLYKVSEEEAVIAATALAKSIPTLDATATLGSAFPGEELTRFEYQHPFLPRTGRAYTAEFVTADAGTGLVHIAPGHGTDDYILGKSLGLQILSPVDDRGCLTAEAGVPELTGVYVFKANDLVIGLLERDGLLIAKQEYRHDYPHCWRTKTPIVFRSVKQWFIKVDGFRQAALEQIENVKWIPPLGKNRIHGSVANRPDWCISRQRLWGVPIPVFFGEGEQALLSADVIRRFADIVEKEGAGVWFSSTADELAQRLNIPMGLQKGKDTLDVWIDSGSSWAAVARRRLTLPADLYLEGSDQHRGWFQSSLSLSVATTGAAPFKQVLTHGFVLNEKGNKYSKSDGAVDLNKLVDASGADVLRLWVASQNYREDIPFSPNILARVGDAYRSIRNTTRILLANLSGFSPERDAVPEDQLTEIDAYLLGRLRELQRECLAAYEAYEFHTVYHAINRFCAVDISALYVDVLKDRMYCDAVDSPRRRSAQTVMREIAETLIKLLAPMAPFTAEEAWQFLGEKESIHLQLFPKLVTPDEVPPSVSSGLQGDAAAGDFTSPRSRLSDRWAKLLALRVAVNEKLEGARQRKEIGKSLEARAEVSAPWLAEGDAPLLEELLIVSQVDVRPWNAAAAGDAPHLAEVHPARGAKCQRCWKFSEQLGQADPAHPDLCPRCSAVVAKLAALG